jgi:hypothetical protein
VPPPRPSATVSTVFPDTVSTRSTTVFTLSSGEGGFVTVHTKEPPLSRIHLPEGPRSCGTFFLKHIANHDEGAPTVKEER